MASLNKCILIALIGSVMMTAVLAQSSAEIPDVAGDALKGAQNAAQGAQESAQTATKGIIGLGSKLLNTGKDIGSAIVSNAPFIGGNNKTADAVQGVVPTTSGTTQADAKEQVTTPVTEVQTDGSQ